MADYQLTATDSIVFHAPDQLWIPDDPANRDWVEYQAWLEEGNEPDPYVEPPPVPPKPTSEQTVLYDHENRVRALEGQPPLSLGDFIAKVNA
jgi:hypothetical protein